METTATAITASLDGSIPSSEEMGEAHRVCPSSSQPSPAQRPEPASPVQAEQAETKLRRPGRSRKSKAGRYRGALLKKALRGAYEERVGYLTSDEIGLLLTLYTGQLFTRLLLCRTIDPIVSAMGWLPPKLAPALTTEEIEVRKRAAYRRVNKLVLHTKSLGFIEVNSQRRRSGDAKDRVLRQLGSEKRSGSLGPRADLISLSREGLRFVRDHLGLSPDGPGPGWDTFQRGFTRPAHKLASAELYAALLTLVELGRLEVIEFDVEHEWGSAVAAREGPPERGVRRGPIPRSDVFLRLCLPGRPDLELEVCVEVDRATERVGIPAPGMNPSLFLHSKISSYEKLAARLGREQVNLAWVVPEHAFKPPASRAKSIDRVIHRVRQERQGRASRVKHLVLPEPTPENVALWLAGHLADAASQNPPVEGEGPASRPDELRSAELRLR